MAKHIEAEDLIKLPGCPWCYGKAVEPCTRCRRLYSVGQLVESLTMLPFVWANEGQGVVPGPRWLHCLDCIAFLLIDRAQLRRQYQRDLRDAERDAQHGARESYQEGRQSVLNPER